VFVAPDSWNANRGNGVGLCRDVGRCQSATDDCRLPVRSNAERKEAAISPQFVQPLVVDKVQGKQRVFSTENRDGFVFENKGCM
jgi:hypothetical protein